MGPDANAWRRSRSVPGNIRQYRRCGRGGRWLRPDRPRTERVLRSPGLGDLQHFFRDLRSCGLQQAFLQRCKTRLALQLAAEQIGQIKGVHRPFTIRGDMSAVAWYLLIKTHKSTTVKQD